MKKLIVLIAVALLIADCGMVFHIDTKYFPAKYAAFNWWDGKMPVDEKRIFGTLGGEEMFTEPTGKSTWMTPDEYCAQWGAKAYGRECRLSKSKNR